MKRLYSIRGAVCASNTKESITENVALMCRTIFEKNNIKSEDLVNIQFTMTEELDCLNPCTALRKSDTGIDTSKVALFGTPELKIKGMLANCIRVMVTVYLEEGSSIIPVYLNGAEVLRPDFANK